MSELVEYYKRQIEWSKKTFGEGRRTGGLLSHIDKELLEVNKDPMDLVEWLDIVILAMDGYWRHGGTPEGFLDGLLAKQKINMARKWPTPSDENQAVEHVREDSEDVY